MKCFYHKRDHDGQCSGAIVLSVYPMCEMFPIDYGEKFPFELINENELVFMVDFSLKPNEMDKLNSMCELIWIDHHITAINSVDKVIKGLRNINHSGCYNTWCYLYPDIVPPYCVQLLSDYDVFQFKNSQSLPFEMGMRSIDTNIKSEIWKYVFASDWNFVNSVVKKGESVLDYMKVQNEQMLQNRSFKLKLEGIIFQVFNCTYFNLPDITIENMATVTMTAPDKWTFSLRSKSNDVSKIAQKYGGGGHEGAAGFVLNSEKTYEILKNAY